jgi:hypothetical protein
MRFAEPFTQSGKSPEAKSEADRLMFLELTQGLQFFDVEYMLVYSPMVILSSLPLGELH